MTWADPYSCIPDVHESQALWPLWTPSFMKEILKIIFCNCVSIKMNIYYMCMYSHTHFEEFSYFLLVIKGIQTFSWAPNISTVCHRHGSHCA